MTPTLPHPQKRKRKNPKIIFQQKKILKVGFIPKEGRARVLLLVGQRLRTLETFLHQATHMMSVGSITSLCEAKVGVRLPCYR